MFTLILGKMYLHNLAKRAFTDGMIFPGEIQSASKLADKLYGDGNGTLNISDVDDIASNVTNEVIDKAGDIIDFITSIF